jgi:trimeric autotransporter adhesin
MRRVVLLLASMSLAVLLACGVAFAAALSSQPKNAPTVHTNDTVWTSLRVGDTVYLGGAFTSVNGKPRSGLAAINANTGRLTAWAPKANGAVLALAASPSGDSIYAGGEFTSVNGIARGHVVAISASTGRVRKEWNAHADLPVYSLATWGRRVYLGGEFRKVNGSNRLHLAAVRRGEGKLYANWAPTTNGIVRTLALSPNKRRLYAGGNYSVISGKRRPNLAALHPATGAVKDWSPNPKVDNDYEVFDLAVTRKTVYVAGGGRDPDGTAEAFSAAKGASVWQYSSNGDFQAVARLKGKLYFGGHFTTLYTKPEEKRRNKLMAVAAPTGRLVARWTPSANGGVWSMTANPGRHRVYAGGAFTEISGRPMRGFAQLSVR